MLVINRMLVQKENKYTVIEEVINPEIYNFKIISSNREYSRLYRNSLIVYKDTNTEKTINILDYEGCSYVNVRNMCCNEFLNSDFFKKYQAEIILIMCSIFRESKKYKNKIFDLNDKSCYKILNSREFLTSDFVKQHYEEIFNTLDKIIIEREKEITKKLNI